MDWKLIKSRCSFTLDVIGAIVICSIAAAAVSAAFIIVIMGL